MSTATKYLRLPPMPKVSDIIRLYGLRARKQLSQNFILDLNITDKISRKADAFDCHVVEIGSGPGSLTRSLLNAGIRHLHAIEIDQRFLPSLEILKDASQGHMTIHHGDIMTFNFEAALKDDVQATSWDSDDLPNLRLVGNLPFSVSIPLLLQWLQAISDRKGPFQYGRTPMTLVFQKEVGENLTAEASNYHRSRLSIMAQNYCHVTRPMILNSAVFTPEPKIDAWLVNLVPRQRSVIDAPFDIIEQVVKAIFSKRKKVIRTPLRRLFPGNEELAKTLIQRANIDGSLRAHQLEIEQFGKITKHFIELCNEEKLTCFPLDVNKPEQIVEDGI